MRAVIPILGVLGLAGPAGAVEPPPYFALPEGIAATRVEYFDYDFVELSYPAKEGRGSVTLEPRGHHWRIWFQAAPGAKPSVIVPALEARGWEILRREAVVVARHAQGGHEAWLVSSLSGSVELIEKSAPRTIELVAPAATPEEVAPNQDAPYFTPLAGFRRLWARRAEGGVCDVRNPVIKEVEFVGRPSFEARYEGDRQVSGLEIQESYVAALKRAGWDVLRTGRANNTAARYSQNGRDVWLNFSPGNGWFGVCIADVGAQAEAARLKRQLDEVGHVAVYGIYFDLDRATLRPEAEATLRQIQGLLEKHRELRLEIQGHTDGSGTHEHNQPLSEERAASVKAWLLGHGIDGARLTTAGYAETRPVAPNTSAEGRQKNRRVELAKR